MKKNYKLYFMVPMIIGTLCLITAGMFLEKGNTYAYVISLILGWVLLSSLIMEDNG